MKHYDFGRLTRVSAVGLAALFVVACGDDKGSGSGGEEDVVDDIPVMADVVDTTEDADVPRFDVDDDANEDVGQDVLEDLADADVEEDGSEGTGCDSVDDCEAGEICVDLLPGPDNGFCTTRCVDDSQCPEGFDCVVIGDDELSYNACVDVDFCLDEDEDGFGLGPGCLGNDCDDTEATINPAADELCNGTDDDCDDEVDNNTIESGDDCETGFSGVCGEGRVACISGLTECVARVEASDEVCDNRDNDCNGIVDDAPTDGTTWYRDQDADRFGVDDDTVVACVEPDGYVDESGDCNDGDRAISPTATEICDGIDNDCDGTIDGPDAVGTVTVYADTDEDGYGNPDTARTGCVGDGWVANADDCDDGDSDINPDAVEICDEIDNDCSGTVDDGVGSEAGSWYLDSDEDGYGNPDDAVYACSPIDGRVSNADDCDDTRDDVHPEGVEVCDGADNNCAGGIDEGVTSRFYRDFDDDGRGDASTFVDACEAPDGYVANTDDCNDNEPEAWTGRAEVCDGIDNNCLSGIDEGVTSRFFRDFDDDDRGDPTLFVDGCAAPDGYVSNSNDCNDREPAAWTGRAEVCDGIDNNCVSGIDEGLTDLYWRDFDDDGRGDPAVTTTACVAPDGYVANQNDCNDREPAAWTGRAEICDGIDNNCVSGIDEGVTVTYWRDADDDGFGNPDISTAACSLPTGYADNDDDCDDTTGEARPGGTEICDGIDNDCVGGIDNGVGTEWFVDNDGDGFGDSSVFACTQPPNTSSVDGDCNDSNPNVNPDADERCDTSYDDDCDDVINEGSAVDATLWFIDADNDGQGAETPIILPPAAFYACEQPEVCLPFPFLCLERIRYSDNDLDCDDTSGLAQYRPGYGDVCDGYDNDCNGTRDDGHTPRFTYYRDGDGDGWGDREIEACMEPIEDDEDDWVDLCCDWDDDDETVH